MKHLPSTVRAAGALRVKHAVADLFKAPQVKPPTMPKVESPITSIQTNSKNTLHASVQQPQFEPKTAGVEEVVRVIGMLGEDAADLGFRQLMHGSNQVLAVPHLAQKAQHIANPEQPVDPALANVRKILNIAGKIASVPVAPEVAGERPLDPAKAKMNFDSNGPAFKATLPDQGNVGTGDFPKMGGDGNANGQAAKTLSENLPHRGMLDTNATGGLMPADAASRAFDQLRAYMKQDNATMNTMGQDVTMETPNW